VDRLYFPMIDSTVARVGAIVGGNNFVFRTALIFDTAISTAVGI